VAKAVDKSLPLNVAATTISVWATIVATIAPKQTARLVVKKAGNVDYFCKYHPNMKGRVVVTP
jgi:plastocyanin